MLKGNQFHGIVRYFDSKLKLQGIISVENRGIPDQGVSESDFLWKRIDKEVLESFIMLQSSDKDRVFILNNEVKGHVLNCKKTQSYFFEDCYKITKQPLMTALDCNPLIKDKEQDLRREDEAKAFRFNLLQNETFTEGDSLYPFCEKRKTFNRDDIRKSINTWWESISKMSENPIWFHPYSQEPFEDPNNPSIEINLNYLAGRNNFKDKSYKIHSHTKLLHTGEMKDGKIITKVSPHNIDDWIGPIRIVIGKFNGTMVTFGPDVLALKKHVVVFGQLHKNNLHGLVRIAGILPNDPNDDCEGHTSSEFGFLGQYKNGLPSGYCWKKLIGGSYIHGKVDANGDFSGDDISYINQDISTAFKGTFKNGIMIKAKHVEVIGERCNDEGIKIIDFSVPSPNSQEYHYEKPTAHSFGDQPLVLDPLDNKYVRLGDSGFHTGETSQGTGQNGAFANIDIPPGTMIAHNNGYQYTKKEMDELKQEQEEFLNKKIEFYKEVEEDEAIRDNTIASLKENTWKYRTSMSCGTLDIPLELGQDSIKYQSTRGHKINHSFGHSIAHLRSYDSARYGITSAIMSRPGMTIKKDSELFINYGYTYTTGPRWYKKLFKDFLFKEEAAKESSKGSLKDCHFKDGSPMTSEQCENYLLSVKDRYLKIHKISQDTQIKNEEILNLIADKVKSAAVSPMQKEFSVKKLETGQEANIRNLIA